MAAKVLNPQSQLKETEEQVQNRVMEYLVRTKSMPFLELASLTDLDNSSLNEIVSRLEERGLVTIKNPGSLVDEIVSLTNVAMTPATF